MATEYFQSSLLAQEMEDTWTGTVRFNAEQGLTEAQKAQARENIGAVPFGSFLKILGHFDTVAELQATAPQNVGDAYSVGATAPYSLYIYDGLREEWKDYGQIRTTDISARYVENQVIAVSAWTQDTSSLAGYSYKAQITVSGATRDDFPIVAFNQSDAVSGNFAALAFSNNGHIEIFAKTKPTAAVTIPVATVIVNGGNGRGITNATGGIATGSIKTANLADGSVTAVKIADRAISVVKSVQLPTTGWIKNSDDVYEVDVTVSGLKTTDTVVLGLRRGTVNPDGWTMTQAAFDSDRETFSKILAGRITAANTLHLYAKEAITDEINAIYLNCWVVSK